MAFNIVLIEPEIPNNTGNIGRLALATGAHLHLVQPFGFELTDKRLKRAGLDYWQHISLRIYEDQKTFFEEHGDKELAFFSSHARQFYHQLNFHENQFLIFGKESTGLDKMLINHRENQCYKIPMYSPHVRSLNLANAVGIVLYEGIRQRFV